MTDRLLEIDNVSRTFEGITALGGFSCAVREGEILGLIGPNGAGKTTLFNVITGFVAPNVGTVVFRGINLVGLPPHRIVHTGIARTFQDLRLIRRMTVLDNVLLSFRGQPGEHLYNLFFRWKLSSGKEAENREVACSLLESADLLKGADNMAEALSYGEQKLLSLACCLALDADLLLLDEPVAGIAPAMAQNILSIIRGLPGQGKSVILIEHDLDVVTQVCDRVVFMDAGAKVSEGTPEEVRNDPKVIDAYIN